MSTFTPDDGPLSPEEEDLALAGEYALGLLEEPERRAFEARLDGEPALRLRVAMWTEDWAAMLDGLPEVPPPRGAEAALMRRLFPEPAHTRAPSFLGRILPWALGGLAAAGIAFLVLRPAGTEPELLARIATEDESLVVQASFDAETRQLRLERTAGAVPEENDLELWLVRLDDAGAPESTVSLGVIPREAEGVIAVSAELAEEFPTNALALSVEPIGGSPTGQATGPVVALGALAAP